MELIEEHVTTEDGVRLFVQKFGTDPKAVVIPNRVFLFDAFKAFAAGRSVIFYDPRNRGRSDRIDDRAKLERGIHHDVDDLDAIRRHFRLGRVDLIGHSYTATDRRIVCDEVPGSRRPRVQIALRGRLREEYPRT